MPARDRRRREIMTKSWHEEYKESPELCRGSRKKRDGREEGKGREGRDELKGKEGFVKKYKQLPAENR